MPAPAPPVTSFLFSPPSLPTTADNAHMLKLGHAVVATIASSVLAAAAIAQEPDDRAAPNAPGLLRGPTVPEKVVRSLVTIDAAGNFIPLPMRPEEAAIEMAALDPVRRDEAQAVITARRTAVGMLLVENIDLVKEGTDAIMSGDDERARAIYQELHGHFDPERTRAPLLADFEPILTPAELGEVTQLVDEYWDAWLAWELRGAPDAPDITDSALEQTEQQLAFRLFQREVGEAYDWALRPFRQRLETLYAITEPDPEQRKAMREAIIDYIRASQLEPTPEQRREVTDRIYDLLDEQQRRRLFEHALWRS